jgi:hypothetical protein
MATCCGPEGDGFGLERRAHIVRAFDAHIVRTFDRLEVLATDFWEERPATPSQAAVHPAADRAD